MKKYYTHNGTEQEGPYTLDELIQKKINTSTMIWYEGLDNWKKASEIEEIKSILTILPPPFKKQGTLNETLNKTKKVLQNDPINQIESKIPGQSKKKTFKWAIAVLAIIGSIAVIGFIVQKSPFGKPNIEESLFVENQKGSVYFESWYKYWHIDIGGYVVNKTAKYRFKDFVIEVKYLSEYNTELLTKKYVINKTVEPLEKVNIYTELKDNAPKGSEKLEWQIVDATVEKVKSID